jgi:predicted metal-dependent HD superfamily phosphohydrolase
MSNQSPIDPSTQTNLVAEKLFLRWQETLQGFKIDSKLIQSSFLSITQAYNSPHRYYHNLKHIFQMLTTITHLESLTVNLPAVQFAAWLHDIVYDTHASNNEEKSAIFARELLTSLNIDRETIDIVENLILATKQHQCNDSGMDIQILLDADLMILAANKIEYQTYAKAIRQEYNWVLETDYLKGRKRVLQQFVSRPKIYQTPEIFRFYEDIARHNMQNEILFLGDV